MWLHAHEQSWGGKKKFLLLFILATLNYRAAELEDETWRTKDIDQVQTLYSHQCLSILFAGIGHNELIGDMT